MTTIEHPRVCASFRAGGELCPNGMADILRYARMSESYGFGDFDAADHVLLGKNVENYPGGVFRWESDSFWPDPLVLLSAVGAVTESILLTTSILVAPLRPAIVIAKMAASIDNMTGGRLRLGVGSGWNRDEFKAANVPYLGRTERMEDYIGACRVLWTQSPASFSSETVSFEELWCRPAPARATGIPVLFGGPATARVADRIARIGDGWLPMNAQRESVVDGVELIRRAFEQNGRDPDSLIVRVPIRESIARDAYARRDGGHLRAEVDALVALGVTDVKIYLPGLVEHPDEAEEALAWISDTLGLRP